MDTPNGYFAALFLVAFVGFVLGVAACALMTPRRSGYYPVGNHSGDADFTEPPSQDDKGTPLTEVWQPAHDAGGADSSKPPRKNPSKRLNVKSGAPRRRKGGGSRRKKA